MNNYLTVSEYCEKYGKDPGNVRKLLIHGRLKGEKLGNQWIIKENQLPPKDKRIKSKKYIDKKEYEFKSNNPMLAKKIKAMSRELDVNYKGNIIRIVIYGSYAKNKQTPESDIDIALFIKKKIDRKKLINISTKYELEIGKVLSVLDIEEEKYNKYKDVLPFYKNIEKEGIEIWKKK